MLTIGPEDEGHQRKTPGQDCQEMEAVLSDSFYL